MHALTTLSLRDWIASLDESAAHAPELLLGGTGHLILSAAEQEAVTRQLHDEILPKLFAGGASKPVCILTGLAPGGDLLFTEVVGTWLRKAGIAYRIIGLLPLPAEDLLADWALAEQSVGREVNDSERNDQGTRIVDTLRACSMLVDLLPPDTASGRLYTEAFRGDQYRRLGACLAQRSDVLVAILRADTAVRPGGTAEVVEWRRNPRNVPAEYSTWPADAAEARHHAAGSLIVIAPEARARTRVESDRSLDRSLEVINTRESEEALRAGNYLLCYDIAERALAHGAHAPRLHHLLLQALANLGSAGLAWRRYEALGLRGDEQNEDWLALKGRLLKDLAEQTGGRGDLLRSAEAYFAAFRRTGGYFPAINAATMFMLGGDPARAEGLARQVLALIARVEPRDEEQRYFLNVSEAEAALLLGDPERCRRCLMAADACARGNVNARSRTRRQFRMIGTQIGLAEDFSRILRLPEVILLDNANDSSATNGGQEKLATFDAGRCREAYVFAALRQASDLDVIEALQAQGARIHLVLSEERAVIIERRRRRFGAAQALRLAHMLERADETLVARGFMVNESDWAGRHIGAIAQGLAQLHAARLGGKVAGIRAAKNPAAGLEQTGLHPSPLVVDAASKAPEGSLAGTQPSDPAASGGRRLAGLIFADIVGFRRLGDHELPRFWSVVMASVAKLLADFGERVIFSNTWGDALHVVTVDALTAAELAVAIQALFEQIRADETGSLARIELRLSAHYGPVFVGHDPVKEHAMFFGSQLALTARIEPVTPSGMNFVTEIFAAQLTLEAPQKFRLDYAGELALAKRHGRHRLYNLRPVGA